MQTRPAGVQDCLYLNIYAPTRDRNASNAHGAAVLVWFYGGSFIHGATSIPLFDGMQLVAAGAPRTRHHIPCGTLSHTAQNFTRHGIARSTVSSPAQYPPRHAMMCVHPSGRRSVRVDGPREGKHAARGFSGIPLTRALEGIRTLTGAGEGDLVVVTVNYRLVRGAGRSVACLFLLLSLLRIRPFACLLAWVVCLLGSLLFLVPALIPLCITSHPEPSENSEPSEKSLGTPAGY